MRSSANYFFFSSRRRHTRLTCDWSSDVCSSDLTPFRLWWELALFFLGGLFRVASSHHNLNGVVVALAARVFPQRPQIGRASCRERVYNSRSDLPRRHQARNIR